METLYLESHNLSESQIEKLVGPKVKSLIKGSTALFIKAVKADDLPADLIGAKANFELREKGFLMYVSKSNKIWTFPIAASDLIKIELQGGEESINLLAVSPMKLLLRMGMSMRYARYFRSNIREYDVTPITLLLDTKHLDLALECSGYHNYSLGYFVEQLKSQVKTA